MLGKLSGFFKGKRKTASGNEDSKTVEDEVEEQKP